MLPYPPGVLGCSVHGGPGGREPVVNRQHLPLCAVALAIGIAGAFTAGVPFSTLVFGLLVLSCPLMLLFLHGGTHASGANHRPVRAAEPLP